MVDRPLDREGQQVHFNRLGDEIIRPRANGSDRRRQAAEARHHHDRNVRAIGRDPLAKLRAAHAGHPQVGQHDVEILHLDQLQRFLR